MTRSKIGPTGILFVLLFFSCFTATAQEMVAPLRYNAAAARQAEKPSKSGLLKTTANVLPFFEDFTGKDIFPDATRWVEHQVYVNNTMASGMVSRGVATFDALDAKGRPYDTTSAFVLRYADSLTSQPFDLSTFVPGDSIYLSFFFQPQGIGFSPETSDSLILFLRSKFSGGTWVKVWAKEGSTVLPFRQVMIPVTDTNFLYNGFSFRFVNKASVNLNDDVWNLDYVRMAANRTVTDTVVNDVAFTTDPTFILNDYTHMPYRQFMADPAAERAAQHTAYIRNNRPVSQNVPYHFTAREQVSGTPLVPLSSGSVNIPPQTEPSVVFTNYTATVPMGGIHDKVVFENKYYVESAGAGDPVDNDTIVREQIFDNYLAYDDGTAEKSYYLNLFPTLPGKVAIEHHLNQPDTLRGLAILFGRQVPTAFSKFFTIDIYKTIAGVNGGTSDDVVYSQEFNQPRFIDTFNRFYIYAFDSPVPLSAGVFYVGATQPALSGSDSLYYALDANRITGNHLYYNVLNVWEPSTVSGALMIRPLLGQPVKHSAAQDIGPAAIRWNVYPNPGSDIIHVDIREKENAAYFYDITDMQGRAVQQGTLPEEGIDARNLAPGMYLVRLRQKDLWSLPLRWVKM